MLSVVFDTNIYISGILFGGKPREILELGRKGTFIIYSSPEIMGELKTTFISKRFRLKKDEVSRIMSNIKSYVKIIHSPSKIKISRDCKDDMILDCALSAGAEYVITGDKDLLVLKNFNQINIITVSEFLKITPWI